MWRVKWTRVPRFRWESRPSNCFYFCPIRDCCLQGGLGSECWTGGWVVDSGLFFFFDIPIFGLKSHCIRSIQQLWTKFIGKPSDHSQVPSMIRAPKDVKTRTSPSCCLHGKWLSYYILVNVNSSHCLTNLKSKPSKILQVLLKRNHYWSYHYPAKKKKKSHFRWYPLDDGSDHIFSYLLLCCPSLTN